MRDLPKQLDTFLRRTPRLGKGVYIARGATVVGDVALGHFASIWYGAVLRGDINRIVVGHHTNVQDNAVLHLSDDFGCILGNHVTVGHSAIIHACAVETKCWWAWAPCCSDGAEIWGAVHHWRTGAVTQGMRIPPGSMVLGAPARVARELTPQERASLKGMAEKYVKNAAYCLKHGINVGGPLGS